MREYRTELDEGSYNNIFAQQMAWFLLRDPLHDLATARMQAQEVMDSSYICRSARMQSECQHDYYDERDGDWTR